METESTAAELMEVELMVLVGSEAVAMKSVVKAESVDAVAVVVVVRGAEAVEATAQATAEAEAEAATEAAKAAAKEAATAVRR